MGLMALEILVTLLVMERALFNEPESEFNHDPVLPSVQSSTTSKIGGTYHLRTRLFVFQGEPAEEFYSLYGLGRVGCGSQPPTL